MRHLEQFVKAPATGPNLATFPVVVRTSTLTGLLVAAIWDRVNHIPATAQGTDHVIVEAWQLLSQLRDEEQQRKARLISAAMGLLEELPRETESGTFLAEVKRIAG